MECSGLLARRQAVRATGGVVQPAGNGGPQPIGGVCPAAADGRVVSIRIVSRTAAHRGVAAHSAVVDTTGNGGVLPTGHVLSAAAHRRIGTVAGGAAVVAGAVVRAAADGAVVVRYDVAQRDSAAATDESPTELSGTWQNCMLKPPITLRRREANSSRNVRARR